MRTRDAPLIYVCSPYSGDTEKNTKKAAAYCREVIEEGFIPIAPHLYLPAFISEEKEREEALEIGLRLLGLCSEVWVYGHPTRGMAGEIEEARRLGIPVKRKKATGDTPPEDGGERKEENVRD